MGAASRVEVGTVEWDHVRLIPGITRPSVLVWVVSRRARRRGEQTIRQIDREDPWSSCAAFGAGDAVVGVSSSY